MTQRSLTFKTFCLCLGGVTLLALFLGSSRGITAIPDGVIDDRFFVNGAVSLLQGKWLGDYNQLTLIKGPFYSIFLAVNHILGLPLLISEQVYGCLSGLALTYALSYFCRNRSVLLLFYSVYVFHPSLFVLTRVVRESVYSSLTVCVIAGGILTMAHLMGRATRYATVHACFFGLNLSCFWLTREESIWLMPCLMLLLSMGFISHYRQTHSVKAIALQSRPLLLSLSLAIACVLSVSLLNYAHYSVFLARSELVSSEFSAAYGALTRVQTTQWDAHIPVNHAARQTLYDTSPKFRALRPHLEKPDAVNAWTNAGCGFYPSTCGDYAGGWFIWALREAVAKAGYADTAPHALAFYRDLATEVNELCDTGQIICGVPHKGTMPPLRGAYLQALPGAIQYGFKVVTALTGLWVEESQQPSHSGSAEELALFTELTRTPANSTEITYCNGNHFNALGWFNRLGGGVRLPRSDGYLVQTVLPSPDLVTAFNDPQLDKSRFQLDVCCKTCVLNLTDAQGRSLQQVDLFQGASYGKGAYGSYHLDTVTRAPSAPLTPNTVKLSVLGALNTAFYQHLWFYADVMALGLWVIRLVGGRYLAWTATYGLATCLLVAVVTRIVLLALIDVTSFPALTFRYLAPCFPLMTAFTVLLGVDTATVLQSRERREALPHLLSNDKGPGGRRL